MDCAHRGCRAGNGGRGGDGACRSPPVAERPMSPRSARTGLRWGWVASMGGALALVGFVGYAQWNGSLARVQFTTSVQPAGAPLAAGLPRMRGPGVVIEIADSNRIVPAGENPANFIVLVDDLRDIVAALWASRSEEHTSELQSQSK